MQIQTHEDTHGVCLCVSRGERVTLHHSDGLWPL